MSTSTAARREREVAWSALVLAWIAGFVNAVTFLQLAHADVSHMTGETVQLGSAIASGQFTHAEVLLIPVPLFVGGVMAGVAAIRAMEDSSLRSSLAPIMWAEALLLSSYVGYGTAQSLRTQLDLRFWWQLALLIALPTVAMGLQTALWQKVRGRRVRTTYITGMLSDLAEDAVDLWLWFWRHTHGRTWQRHWRVLRLLPRQATWVRSLVLAGIWLSFLCGALCGAYAEPLFLASALIAPSVALVLLALVEWVHPTTTPMREPTGPS